MLGARRAHLRRRCGCGSAPTPPDELAAIVAGGGRRGEIYRAPARRPSTATATRSAARFPDIPRRVSGYNLAALLPENGFDVARALVGSEGTLRHRARGDAAAGRTGRRRARSWWSASPTSTPRPATVPAVLELGPIGLEGMDDRLIARQRAQGPQRRGPRAAAALGCSRTASSAGCLLVEFGGDDAGRGRRRARRAPRARSRELPGFRGRRCSTPPQQQRMWELRESGPRRHRARARQERHLGGVGGLGGAAGAPRRLPARPARRCYDELRLPRLVLRPLRAGVRAHPHLASTSTPRRGSTSYRALRRGGRRPRASPTAARSPASTATARAAASCCRGCSATSCWSAFRDVKAALDPEGRMNPGKVVDPYPIVVEPAARARVPAGAADDRTSRFAARRRLAGARDHALRRRRQVPPRSRAAPCAPATASRSTSSTRRAAAPTCCTRCSSARSIAGRLAVGGGQGGARPLPGLQGLQERLPGGRRRGDLQGGVPLPLLPPAACGRGRPTRWAGSRGGRGSRRRRRGVVNALMAAPGLSRLLKAAAGITRERARAALRHDHLARAMAKRQARDASGGRSALPPRPPHGAARRAPAVLLYADTFTNFFDPEIGEAAVEVLEAAGFRVELPPPRCSAAAGRSTTTASSAWRNGCCAATSRCCATPLRARRPDRRPRALLRRHLPRRAARPLPRRPRRAAAHAATSSPSPSCSSSARRTGSRRSSPARPSSTATATTRR